MIGRFTSSLRAFASGPLVDRIVGAVVLLLGLGAITSLSGGPAQVLAGVLAIAVMVGALLVRDRRPPVTLAVVLAVVLAISGSSLFVAPALIALFAVAGVGEGRTILIGALATAGTLVAAPAVHGHPDWSLAQIVSRVVVVAATVAFGLYRRERVAYIAELAGRAERAERERALDAARAVAEERVRIARELHDVVAHSVSLMIVQAQAAAAHLSTKESDAAAEASLRRVGDLGREALTEMRRMLGILRLGDDHPAAAELAPAPGLRDLPALVSATRDGALEVGFTIRGEPISLPAGIELSAYRIVQEGLTNVVRHAGAGRAAVTVTYEHGSLAIEIVDDGRGPSPGPSDTATGHGLLGMRERAALYEGSLVTGAGADGHGFRVVATLPLRGLGGDPASARAAGSGAVPVAANR